MLRFALFGMDSFGDDVRSGDFPEELIMCLLISRCLKYRLNKIVRSNYHVGQCFVEKYSVVFRSTS